MPPGHQEALQQGGGDLGPLCVWRAFPYPCRFRRSLRSLRSPNGAHGADHAPDHRARRQGNGKAHDRVVPDEHFAQLALALAKRHDGLGRVPHRASGAIVVGLQRAAEKRGLDFGARCSRCIKGQVRQEGREARVPYITVDVHVHGGAGDKGRGQRSGQDRVVTDGQQTRRKASHDGRAGQVD